MTERELLELQLIQLKEQKKRLAKVSFIDYLEFSHRGLYRRSKVHTLIAETLEKVERGEIKRLIINMPPRHGKSMTITETYPAWYLGKNPTKRVMAIAYGATLAERFGEKNRIKVDEFGKEIFTYGIAKGKSNKTNWDLDNNVGGMLSTGIDGSIVGQGADLMIIDDPHKNQKEAMSARKRQEVWDRWQGDLNTRIHKDGAVIVIMTRWHEDDLCGRLLNPEYGEVEDWHVLSLPAIAEEDGDILGRKTGDVLWKEHFSDAWYKTKMKSVGQRNWTSQYQQRPASEEGERIKKAWIRYYDTLPCSLTDFDMLIQSWDLAGKGNKNSDYTVGGLLGRKGPDIYLIDMFRKKVDFPEQLQGMINFSNTYPMSRIKLIEDASSGIQAIPLLKKNIQGIVAQKVRNKEEKVDVASVYFESGNIYLPSLKCKTWSGEVVDELITFPNAKHDDIVDMMTQGIIKLVDMYVPLKEHKAISGTFTKTEKEDLGIDTGEKGYKTLSTKSYSRHKSIRR